MHQPGDIHAPPRQREVFCNRTLNMRAIRAVGYDMDYTLLHYRVAAWELRAYEHLKGKLLADGWPVGELVFDPALVVRGLVLDTQLGNIVKANRFGYVKKAFHGTRPIDFNEQRTIYSRVVVDLAEPRWSFLNTFFSLSEACMYAQLVDLLDAQKLPPHLGYGDLFARVQSRLDEAHMEGQLKAEIVANPDAFVVLDPETPLTLLDQHHAGKKLLLITNSEWGFTRSMMDYAFDRFLPEGTTWRDLFDVIVVSARKPDFFINRPPLLEVVNEEGLLRPSPMGLRQGGIFFGGNAALLESHLELSGEEILYVGDHLYGDVQVTKKIQRWRTALILRELEDEIAAVESFRPQQARLSQRMAEKEQRERGICQLQLQLQRCKAHYGPPGPLTTAELEERIAVERAELMALDDKIVPLARAAGEIGNPRWGLLTRAGNDKSYLARQLERHADIYTSRVSNLMYRTPFAYLLSPRGSLPHDPG